MTSRERIKKILDLKVPDRVGTFDDFAEGAIQKWQTEKKLPADTGAQDYFDLDIRLFGFDQSFEVDSENTASLERINNASSGESLKNNYESARKKGKFMALACTEPFEHIAGAIGREKILTMMAEEGNKAANLFADSSEFTLNMCQLILDKGYHFDGGWLGGDLGYEKGLIFSTDYYNAFLFDLHKEFCDFFTKNGMPVIFHSHGNIKELMPHLIETGVRAIEPLEANVGMDLSELKREYGRDIVIMGGIDETSFRDIKKAEKEIKGKFKFLMKDGGYIYRGDSPVAEDISFENYKGVVELVKQYGTY